MLFLGATGLFKNPLSHRDLDLDNSTEAYELVGFADLLLRIIESRRSLAQPDRI